MNATERATYWRLWYANGGTAAQRQKLTQTAADRAKARLVAKYREEYQVMVDEEREALGIPPSKRIPGRWPKSRYVPSNTFPEEG